MLFSIERLKGSEWVEIFTLDPTENTRRDGSDNPKPDTAQGALRAYGMAHPKKDGTAISGKGVHYRATPVEKVKNSPKRISAAKVRGKSSETVDAPFGLKKDGTPAKRRGRKPGQTAAAIRDTNLSDKVAAPYGYKKDGVTPRKRPGRKGNGAVSATDQILAQIEALKAQAEALGVSV